MNKIFTSLLFLLTFSSCIKDKNFLYSQRENSTLFEEKVILEETGVLTFNLDKNSTFWHYSSNFNKSNSDSIYYYSFLNNYDNSIVYYNVKSKEEKKVYLKKDGENGLGFVPPNSTHLFVNPNDLFVYNSGSGILFNIDSIGNIKNKYDIVNYKTNDDIPFPEPSNITPFIVNNDDIYFSCGLNKFRENYTNYGMVLKFNLKSKKAQYILPFPDIYNKAFWGSPFKYLTNFALNIDSQKMAVNYPISPFIYTSDLDGNIIDSTYVGSKYFNAIEPMTFQIADSQKKNRDYKKEDVFSLSNSDFPKIMYDVHNNIYYRIAYVRPTIEDVKLGITLTDFSVIILDEKFVKIGETKFSSKTYDNSMMAITDLGLMLARKDLYNKNDNKITFSVFNLKPTK